MAEKKRKQQCDALETGLKHAFSLRKLEWLNAKKMTRTGAVFCARQMLRTSTSPAILCSAH
ncbi:MAG: hypothetical protein P1U64_00090 [Alcanivoracaceae bacterium]|nr:hypothetical protein [Alcanivoracaceae bacterium]